VTDLDMAEAYAPIELDLGDPNVAYLNVAVNFNGDAFYAPYPGSAGPQDEWVIVNLPIEIPSGPGHYHGGFFALTDVSAKSGIFAADFWVTPVPLGGVLPGTGTASGLIAITVFDRDQFGPPSTAGPSGGPLSATAAGDDFEAASSPIGGFAIAAASATRALPDRQQQVDAECFITSVAMSMKWLEQQYPNMFGQALPAIGALITAMKQTDEWQTHNIIRWGHLSEWKRTIFGQYQATVAIHQWNGTDDAYTDDMGARQGSLSLGPLSRRGAGRAPRLISGARRTPASRRRRRAPHRPGATARRRTPTRD
jgi:hypothetical protein